MYTKCQPLKQETTSCHKKVATNMWQQEEGDYLKAKVYRIGGTIVDGKQ